MLTLRGVVSAFSTSRFSTPQNLSCARQLYLKTTGKKNTCQTRSNVVLDPGVAIVDPGSLVGGGAMHSRRPNSIFSHSVATFTHDKTEATSQNKRTK
jgi:hypothetical protein